MVVKNIKSFILFICFLFALILTIISFFVNDPKPLKYVSLAGTIIYFFVLLYIKFIWRLKIICRLRDRADLNGKWNGVIIYDKGNGYEAGEKSCLCTIKQDLLNIQITITTDEIISYSVSSTIIKNNNLKTLFYIYRSETNKKYREKNPNKYGTTTLTIIDDNHLDGEYWTNGKSSGLIKLVKMPKLRSTEKNG